MCKMRKSYSRTQKNVDYRLPNHQYFTIIVAIVNKEIEILIRPVIGIVMRYFLRMSPVNASTKEFTTNDMTIPVKMLINHSFIWFITVKGTPRYVPTIATKTNNRIMSRSLSISSSLTIGNPSRIQVLVELKPSLLRDLWTRTLKTLDSRVRL